MPTWQRRFHINHHSNKLDEKLEEKNISKTKDGKTSISGETLKQKLKTNQIPNQ